MVGLCPIYLNGHDELHSPSKNIDANSISVLDGFRRSITSTTCSPAAPSAFAPAATLTTGQGSRAAWRWSKRYFPIPDPRAGLYQQTTINFVKGWKGRKTAERVFIYQVSDHKQCYEEVESPGHQAPAGVPPVAAATLVAQASGTRKPWVNVEEPRIRNRSSPFWIGLACRPRVSETSPADRGVVRW